MNHVGIDLFSLKVEMACQMVSVDKWESNMTLT